MDFLKNRRRFSFNYGGKPSDELECKVTATEGENELITVYDFADGLRITNIAKKYPKYSAYEWVNHIENTSERNSQVISDLFDCDTELALPHAEKRKWTAYMQYPEDNTVIYSPKGSVWQSFEFYDDPQKMADNGFSGVIFPGEERFYANANGRSSDGTAPFFNISSHGKGYVAAVGWTGQWNAKIARNDDSVRIRTKIEDTHFYLLPGEKIRTSSVVIMPYSGEYEDGQNKWRRLVREHFSLIGSNGRAEYPPFCAGIWGGMSSDGVIKRVKRIKELGLPFEYIWMDAGWYGTSTQESPDEFEGDWGVYTGDWRVNEFHHPDGLCEVRREIENAGMKFLLWFEPERVRTNTPIYSKHPEYFLDADDDCNKLLNLGNENALQYCIDTLSSIIEKLQINCYRQDFNMPALTCFRKADSENRHGITEIKHINGLYRLWDTLLEKFPSLIIDNCASGGRRIDIETLRRSVPLWRSDAMCPANFPVQTAQIHNLTFGEWLPFCGTGTGRAYDEYRVRSCYAVGLTTNYTYSERDAFFDTDEKAAYIKKYTTEYLRIREYFTGDIYRLTEPSDKSDVWAAVQYNRPENCDGMVQAFRRENSPYSTAFLRLRGIDESKSYVFCDIDGGEFSVSGRELCENGLRITVEQKRKAKILLYRAE